MEALKRVAFGGLKLDEGLKPGEYRELSAQEVLVYMNRQEILYHELLLDKEAVIFDLDGSLVDSMWMWRDRY